MPTLTLVVDYLYTPCWRGTSLTWEDEDHGGSDVMSLVVIMKARTRNPGMKTIEGPVTSLYQFWVLT